MSRSLAARIAERLPEPLSARLRPAAYRYSPSDVPARAPRLDGEVRLYVGAVNFAGQGFAWARAAERLVGVAAHAMQFRAPGMPLFPIDTFVPVNAYRFSRRWQTRQFDAVARHYTHVLLEAARPLFGRLFDGDPIAEVAALRERGVQVGLVSHGSDLRDPDRHAAIPSLLARVLPAGQRFDSAVTSAPLTMPETPARLLIAPVNSAGQGWAWARAAERLPGVGARAMAVRSVRDFGFAADQLVSLGEYRWSTRWQAA